MYMDILSISKESRKGEKLKDGFYKTERAYFDFLISNQLLGKLFGIPKSDLIGAFGWSENIEYENKRVDEFLGLRKPELETGRSCFFVCPECGDIGCGAITGKIEISDNIVIWTDFGYENGYAEPLYEKYNKIGPFTFDKSEYVKIIRGLKQ